MNIYLLLLMKKSISVDD